MKSNNEMLLFQVSFLGASFESDYQLILSPSRAETSFIASSSASSSINARP
jgi:hypothetical protein